jgi:hypothetical protein
MLLVITEVQVLQALLFEVSLLSTHSGSWLTYSAGIPTIIKPFFGDQAFWSERVESLGVGSAVRKLTAENLTEALLKATTDEKQIAKAKVVGEMIRKVSWMTYMIQAKLTLTRRMEWPRLSRRSTEISNTLNPSSSPLLPIPTKGVHLDLGKWLHFWLQSPRTARGASRVMRETMRRCRMSRRVGKGVRRVGTWLVITELPRGHSCLVGPWWDGGMGCLV